jgi:hypothetical protein
MQISFGDKVRVRSTPLTEARGVAGLIGQVYGVTTPSVTHVEVLGDTADDQAINVFFEAKHESHWFATDLLEFVDHAPGTEITLKGVSKKWVRVESGDWSEREKNEKPWWKFW